MKVYNLYVSVRPISTEISSFTMGLHVLFESYCNCTWFWYLFGSSTMSSMILSVRNSMEYDKVSWSWGVFLTRPVIPLNSKSSSFGLWNALSSSQEGRPPYWRNVFGFTIILCFLATAWLIFIFTAIVHQANFINKSSI